MGKRERLVEEIYADDPERADAVVFGRRAGLSRRGFLEGAGLAAMSAAVGGPIVLAAHMPGGLIPAAFAQEPGRETAVDAGSARAEGGPQRLRFPGKDPGLVVIEAALVRVAISVRRTGSIEACGFDWLVSHVGHAAVSHMIHVSQIAVSQISHVNDGWRGRCLGGSARAADVHPAPLVHVHAAEFAGLHDADSLRMTGRATLMRFELRSRRRAETSSLFGSRSILPVLVRRKPLIGVGRLMTGDLFRVRGRPSCRS